MKMYVGGRWTDSPTVTSIIAPYSGETVDPVPVATPEQVELALATAEAGAAAMAKLTAYERCQIMLRAADLFAANLEDLARTITLEEGKPLSEARGECVRMPDFLRLCGFEGSQKRGETLTIDAHSVGKGKMGMTVRIPCGIVVAISPFNYPLLLVLHKVAPALASGNAVILKPANQTPLIALKMTKLFLDAGLPENALQCITGSGSNIGPALCADRRVRKISFTGSTQVGEQIAHVAGVKKLSLELGANCRLIILADANLELAAQVTATGGFVNAGQVCVSAQRILVQRKVYADFLDALKKPVEVIKVGDPLADGVTLSAMINEAEAVRVSAWIDEAVAGGARLVTGGQREGAIYAPTIVADVKPNMRISCEELFGPAVAVTPVDNIDEAIALANDTNYALSAGIFTRDINCAWRFARGAQSGNVHINWSPLWRAGLMPYLRVWRRWICKERARGAVEKK